MKVAIIGLGLIGGSLGLNLMKNKFISTVSGIDANKAHEQEALRLGIVHEITCIEKLNEFEMIFLATPVGATVSILSDLPALSPNCTIVDFGSTKQVIKDHVPSHLKEQFILAHPMAGTEHSGPQAAFAELFSGAVCVLCDAQEAAVMHQHRLIELLTNMGMRLCFMNTQAHDHHSAIISHLPHVISFALANYVLGCEKAENIVSLAGGSFADMSRIAKSSPAMWESIFVQNKDNVIAALDGFMNELQDFKSKLLANDKEQIVGFIQSANRLKDIL